MEKKSTKPQDLVDIAAELAGEKPAESMATSLVEIAIVLREIYSILTPISEAFTKVNARVTEETPSTQETSCGVCKHPRQVHNEKGCVIVGCECKGEE